MIATSRSLTVSIRSIRSAVSHRSASSNCAPAEKLRCIFEEYRLQNYSRELPSRFKKELIRAVQPNYTGNQNAMIEVDSLNRILMNIGRADEVLSEEELELIVKEAGGTSRSLSTDAVLALV